MFFVRYSGFNKHHYHRKKQLLQRPELISIEPRLQSVGSRQAAHMAHHDQKKPAVVMKTSMRRPTAGTSRAEQSMSNLCNEHDMMIDSA